MSPRRLLLALPSLAACVYVTPKQHDDVLAALAEEEEDSPVDETAADSDSEADSPAESSDETARDSDSDPGVAPSLSWLDPDYGTTSGGERVVLLGAGFTADTWVRFGGQEVTILDIAETALAVVAPSAASPGAVDVEVGSAAGSATLPAGYTYYQDGTGLTGAVGAFAWYDHVGGYWNNGGTDFGDAWLALVEPTSFTYWEVFAPELDACASGYVYPGALAPLDLDVAELLLSAPDGLIVPLPWSTTNLQGERDSLAPGEFQAGRYDLRPVASPTYPPFDVPDLFSAPDPFTVSAPAIGGSTEPPLSRGFTLSWSGGSPGDYVLASFGLSNSAGTGLDETVTCAIRDDGAFTVPSAAFTSWPTGRTIYVSVGRAVGGHGEVRFNHASSAMVGIYWVLGAGTTQ